MSSNPTETNSTSEVTAVDPATAKAASRRRLLKASMTASPVVLTLVSRPVLAWHCKSPSAWGSEALDTKTSLAAKHPSLADESYTITDWKDNTIHSGSPLSVKPWAALGRNISNPSSTTYYKKYKMSELFGSSLPAGLTGDTLVWASLQQGAATTTFQKYMIVARLNYKVISNIRTCVTVNGADQLQLMINGSYTPAHLNGEIWDSNKIMTYLQQNWIVQP